MTVLPIYPGTPPPVPSVKPVKAPAVREYRQVKVDPGSFQRELGSLIKPEKLTFSRHAQKRLEMRGIQFTQDGLRRIEDAVDRVDSKGSRNALVVAGNLSLVVSVTNRTVVTVMNTDSMDESVVTNIDSAVFA